jgi:proteasome alpha subunit
MGWLSGCRFGSSEGDVVVAMQFYASPEQIMRDRSELARKGIARGRSAVVLSCADGVLFVAENLSSALHKVSEIYDRIGFAAVGRYNEFENLRRAGVRMADLNGLAYDRRDVTGRGLANTYAQILGTIFTEQSKPFEVEICLGEVGVVPGDVELCRLTYVGAVSGEPGRMAGGGHAESIAGGWRGGVRAEGGGGEGGGGGVRGGGGGG